MPRTARAIAKRDRVLDAAIGVFGRLGFNNASLSIVAKAAGLNKATLYYYFPDGKDELLRAAFEKHFNEMLSHLRPAMHGPGAPADRLRAYLRKRMELHTRSVRENAMTLEALYELTPLVEARAKDLVAPHMQEFAELLQACRPDLDADWTLMALTANAALKGVLLDAHPVDDAEIEARVRAFEALVLQPWGRAENG